MTRRESFHLMRVCVRHYKTTGCPWDQKSISFLRTAHLIILICEITVLLVLWSWRNGLHRLPWRRYFFSKSFHPGHKRVHTHTRIHVSAARRRVFTSGRKEQKRVGLKGEKIPLKGDFKKWKMEGGKRRRRRRRIRRGWRKNVYTSNPL